MNTYETEEDLIVRMNNYTTYPHNWFAYLMFQHEKSMSHTRWVYMASRRNSYGCR